MTAASSHRADIALMLRASYSLAFYALLRPTEYMLTPLHNAFDKTRHMRACDIQFHRNGTQLDLSSAHAPDSYRVNIKMSKNDQARDDATTMIGATHLATCPVAAMWAYFRHTRPAPDGPLFTSPTGLPLRYPSALKVLQMHIGADGYLYGLH